MRTRHRLTITLPHDIVSALDSAVDGKTIRNRSHAIEYLLRAGLPTVPETAILLAGSHTTTPNHPAFKKIAGKCLLDITLDHLKQYGVKKVLICASAHESRFRAHLKTNQPLGLTIDYVGERKPLGTAGILKKAAATLKRPFLVLHGDVLTDLNLSDFAAFHRSEGTLATMAVKPRMGEKKYGQVFLQGNRIIKFLSKSNQGISIVNTGIYVLEPEVVDRIPFRTPANLETDVFPILAEKGELSAFIFQGVWFDISKPENYQEAQRRWQTN